MFDEKTRRNNGIFYTPTLFVDYAHKMISEQLGDNWKDEYVVYDCCCGGKNLTRDYKFKELYCSTLFESELKIADRYNKEATSFQFDFLNDYIPMPDELVQGETKIPQGLLDAFKENKKIVFFLNPPYVGNGNIKQVEGVDKNKGLKDTMISSLMQSYGKSSNNLYAQFLYRILLIKQQYRLTNTIIGIYSPSLFLTGNGFSIFRNDFLNNFSYKCGVLFKASHFADVADNWGISFSLWDSNKSIDKNNFNYSLIDAVDGEIQEFGKKTIYNIDGQIVGRDWVKEPVGKAKMYDTLPLTSALNIGNNPKGGTKLAKGSIGCYVNESNNIDKNTQFVCLLSSGFNHTSTPTTSILPSNFTRVCVNFSARRLIEKNWINSKDEYLAPNESHQKFNEFVNDSVIYSLFNTASNQSSLRQVEYKGKQWDIKNEFFWMGKDEIANLANEHQLDAVYEDAKTSNERYVYQYIQLHKEEFSKEATAVLDKAIELTKKSFKYRQLFADEHPEYQLDKCWDCGYYQLKAIWKEFMKDDFEEFKKLYKELGDKMRPMVYELGFLK